MSATPNDGGPAFPMQWNPEDRSLRDWFAGQALSGLLACPTIIDGTSSAEYAAASYKLADLMMAARETKTGGQQ